jgi:hypothetical protein
MWDCLCRASTEIIGTAKTPSTPRRFEGLSKAEKWNILSNVLFTKYELLCYTEKVETCGVRSVGDTLPRLRGSTPPFSRGRRGSRPACMYIPVCTTRKPRVDCARCAQEFDPE